ncbi:DUF397 domain-containing protein [Streptomyces sp. PSAA01]|nr:DUF397 domain-containing protein [Streptomyces sp. PSAA01]MCG0288804.1 DUF397 domain-containing protein [Streptomyces sp. PSAA01]
MGDGRKPLLRSARSVDCVEVATTPTTIHIRDSKDPDGPRLHIAATA